MARLVNDSGVLGDAVEVTAETINEVSFDKIIEAIHVMQEEMGISGITAEEAAAAVEAGLMTEEEAFEAMGTTAKEASKTITGSVNAMKSSWQNLVGALANDEADIEYFVDNFVDSVVAVAENILPRIETALSGVGTLVTKLAPVISKAIPTLVTNVLPGMIEAGISVLDGIITGIIEALPALAEQAPVIIRRLMNALDDVAWMLWDAGETLIGDFGSSILENGRLIVGSAIENLMIFLSEKLGASDESLSAFHTALETAWGVISGIFDSIKGAIDTVATALSDSGVTWESVWTGISDALSVAGGLIESAITLIGDTIGWLVTEATTDGTTLNGIWTSIQVAVSTAATVIQGCLDFLIAVINGDWSAAWDSAKGIVEDCGQGMEDTVNARFGGMAAKAYEKGYQIGTELRENFEQARAWAIEKFEKIKSGISEKIEAAKEKVRTAIDAIKGFFNFTFTWPHIPLPHFSITPSGWKIGDLLKGSIPSLGISWYAKAMDNPMILDSPTAFGINAKGQIMAGGEAGEEVVSGKDTLLEMIAQAVASRNEDLLDMMAKIYELLSLFMPQVIDGMGREVVLDSGVLVGQLTPAIDRKLGTISKYKARGN